MPDTAARSTVNPTQVDGLRAAAAQLVTEALTTGNLRHPNRPEVALFLPGFRTEAHPDPQVADAITQTARMIGEALIDTVLKGLAAELVRTTDLEQLRTRAANVKPNLITVTCQHRQLMQLAVKPGTDTADINCRRLHAHLTACQET